MALAPHSRLFSLVAACGWATAALGGSAALLRAAPATAAPAPVAAPGQEESAQERRAVRGSPLDAAAMAESPELREMRRFEEHTFPRGGTAGPLDVEKDGTEGALPPELEGRWNGSGDVPAALRTPESSRAPARTVVQPESSWLRSLKLPELPVRWDPRVVRYLDFFKGDPKGRAIMAGWLRRLGRFRAVFEAALDREGLPRDLVYLSMIESGFEPGAVSRVGAGGLWQFMPGAARAYGLEVSYWVDRRRDPERAAEAAARYLKDLYVRFGSWPLAFAAYNAGYGAILNSIARYNTNDFWELCRHEAGLPWETSLYVPKLLAAAIVGHNLEAFGFASVAPDPPFAYDLVDVPPATQLTTIARAAGCSVEAIGSLNPELIRARTPPDRGPLRVRVPPGTGATFAQELNKASAGPERTERVVLRFGETLDDLAKARGISTRELRRLNGLKDSGELRGGTTVLVPTRPGASVAKAAVEPAAIDAQSPAPPDDLVMVAVPERTFSYEGRERVFYRTRDADTIEEVAEVFQVGADEVAEWNNIDPTAKLQPKMVLQVFVSKQFDRSQVALLDSSKVRVVTLGSEEFHALEAARRGKTRLTYTARPGDTLARIARRYGLAPGDLARINRLSYNAELADGQRIVVYSPTPELPREVVVGRTGPVHRRPNEKVAPIAERAPTQRARETVTTTASAGKVPLKKGPVPGSSARDKPNTATAAAIKTPNRSGAPLPAASKPTSSAKPTATKPGAPKPSPTKPVGKR